MVETSDNSVAPDALIRVEGIPAAVVAGGVGRTHAESPDLFREPVKC